MYEFTVFVTTAVRWCVFADGGFDVCYGLFSKTTNMPFSYQSRLEAGRAAIVRTVLPVIDCRDSAIGELDVPFPVNFVAGIDLFRDRRAEDVD